MPAQLTVLIPCKNERKNIRHCIESARMVGDEILVADSGSTDGTLDIVREMGGCRIIEREFVSYPDFKNWAIPQASHSWVLVLDADERLPLALAAEILETLHDPPEDLDGFWIGFRSHLMGYPLKRSGYNTPAFRLFRRDKCRYGDRLVHEEIEVDKKRASRLKNRIDHYSYWSYDQYLLKNVRYTRMGAQDRFKQGKRASFTSLFFRPLLRFLHLYVIRGGFLDGLAGLQMCILTSFFNTFVKQARLWELEHGQAQPDPDSETGLESTAKQEPDRLSPATPIQPPPTSDSLVSSAK